MLKFFSKKILYFPGCLASSFLPEIVENYQKIFTRLKIDYNLLGNICCGAVAYNNGYTKDFEELKDANAHKFSASGRKLVTNSVSCRLVLKEKFGLDVLHVTELLAKYKDSFPIRYEEEISYYDPVDFDVYEAPRELLDSVGFDVVELARNRENTVISGAEGGMIQNIPVLANGIVQDIFQMCKTKKLIVADPLVYFHLKKNAPKKVEVLELSEVLI